MAGQLGCTRGTRRGLLVLAALLGCATAMTSFDRRWGLSSAAQPGDIPLAEWPWTLATRPPLATPELDCPLRALVAAYAARLNGAAIASDVERSLRLRELCPNSTLPAAPAHHGAPRARWEARQPRRHLDAAGLCSVSAPPPIVFFVAPAPTGGSDNNGGTQASPFATLQRALTAVDAARFDAGVSDAPPAACVWMRGGTYRLAAAAVVVAGNIEIAAFPGETPVLSGAVRVATPTWSPFGAAGGGCFVAAGAAPTGLTVSAVFDAAGALLNRARYPNTNVTGVGAPYPQAWLSDSGATWLDPPPEQQCESFLMQIGDARPAGEDKDPELCLRNFTDAGGMWPCFQARVGCGSSRFDPPTEPGPPRSVCGGYFSPGNCNSVPGGINLTSSPPFPWPFAHPEDAMVHAMKNVWGEVGSGANLPAQGLGWFSLSWQGAAANGSNLLFGRGGFQAGQGGKAGNPFLDFCVENALELLDFPGEAFYDSRSGSVYACIAPGDAPGAQVELAVTRYLLAVGVPGGDLVQSVSVRGLGFARTRSTILEPHGVPGGGDMSAHARGALTISNAEGVTVAQCSFTDVGGSAVVVAGHALGVQVVDSTVVGAGAHGVLVLGFSQLIDATGSNLPRGTRVAGNSISLTGRENKFAASVAVAIAPRTVVEGNVIYDVPRSAVYYNDMSASPAQILHNNALFNTNRETTDTGPVYTYQRLVFLGDNVAGPSVEPDLSQHEGNLIMANYGSFWPLDYDDGTMNVQDSANVFLYGGTKQYLGRATTHSNNWYAYADLGLNFGRVTLSFCAHQARRHILLTPPACVHAAHPTRTLRPQLPELPHVLLGRALLLGLWPRFHEQYLRARGRRQLCVQLPAVQQNERGGPANDAQLREPLPLAGHGLGRPRGRARRLQPGDAQRRAVAGRHRQRGRLERRAHAGPGRAGRRALRLPAGPRERRQRRPVGCLKEAGGEGGGGVKNGFW